MRRVIFFYFWMGKFCLIAVQSYFQVSIHLHGRNVAPLPRKPRFAPLKYSAVSPGNAPERVAASLLLSLKYCTHSVELLMYGSRRREQAPKKS